MIRIKFKWLVNGNNIPLTSHLNFISYNKYFYLITIKFEMEVYLMDDLDEMELVSKKDSKKIASETLIK